jgi:hypothetical protein
MTAPLTPALALAHLREFSLDVRAAVVLDPAGEPLAGDAGVAASARAVIEGAESATVGEDQLLVARTPDGGAIALVAGEFALLPLLEHDLAAVAAAALTRSADTPGT